MVLHNPNNWHWVNKDASAWARDYLDKELIGVAAEDKEVSATIDKILTQEGDCDVSQRKGKVITLFDLRLQLEYSGKTADEDSVSGTINIPEVAHDTEEDEFVFEIDIYTEAPSKQPVKDLVRAQILPQLRKKLVTLAPALITAHAKDLQHAAGANPSATFTAPKYYASSSINKSTSSAPAANPASNSASVNTTTLELPPEEFRCPAIELYACFTDPGRLSAFTRAAPRVFEGARAGAKFELFDGNVSGSFESLDAPTALTQQWRLAQWPAGHFSRLELRFEQNDVDAVTVMRVKWSGIPVGQEEVTKRNWGEYFVRSIKTTFGFGTVL